MKEFLKNKSWEDYTIYSLLGLLGLGIVFFVFGYLFSFKVTYELPIFKDPVYFSLKNLMGTSDWEFIYGIEKAKTIDSTNLFTFMGSLVPGMTGYSMCALSVSGFALIMVAITIMAFLFFLLLSIEYIWPMIRKTNE